MSFALAKALNACRSIMIKSCIVLVSLHHEGMLTFNFPVILAKPEPLVSAPTVCVLSEQRPETSWLLSVVFTWCVNKNTPFLCSTEWSLLELNSCCFDTCLTCSAGTFPQRPGHRPDLTPPHARTAPRKPKLAHSRGRWPQTGVFGLPRWCYSSGHWETLRGDKINNSLKLKHFISS